MRNLHGWLVSTVVIVALVAVGAALGPVRGASGLGSAGTPTPSALTQIANQQLVSLGPRTQIVACNSSVSQLPPYTVTAPVLGAAHYFPGRYTLADGRCAFDPDVTPAPLRSDSADAP
jgi:hypothetical protein